MPLEPSTPERRRAMTRDHLLAAAAAVFARRGYHAATLDEVAEAAGFSKGACVLQLRQQGRPVPRPAPPARRAAGQRVRRRSEPAPQTRRRRSPRYAGSTQATEDRQESWACRTEFMLYAIRNPPCVTSSLRRPGRRMRSVVDLVDQQCQRAGIDPPLDPIRSLDIYAALFQGLWQRQAIDPEAVDDDLFATAVVFVRQAIEALGTVRQEIPRPSEHEVSWPRLEVVLCSCYEIGCPATSSVTRTGSAWFW